MANRNPPDSVYAWDLLWVGFLALYAFAGYALVPFHGDESMLIFMSRDFAYQFIQGDPSQLYYDESKPLDLEQNLRLINGTVNKYTIGLAWYLNGFTLEQINGPWYWEDSYEDNASYGTLPSQALLHTSRLPSALFLTGSVVLLFFAAKLFAGRPAAYMATLYYALNPAVLLNGRRAMMEGSLLFGGLAVLLCAILFVRARGWRMWAVTPFLALAAGLAVSSKHTNVFIVASVFIGCALHALAHTRRQGMHFLLRRAGGLLVAGVVGMGVFFALNPAWWASPVDAATFTLQERAALLRGQVAGHGGYDSLWEQINGFYQQVFVGEPMLYEVVSFREPLAEIVATYNASPVEGVRLPGASVVLVTAFGLGLVCLFSVSPLPDINADARWVVGSYATLTTLFVLFVTPLEWQRYYLPVMPVVALIAPLGVIRVVRWYARDAHENSPLYRKGSARVSS